MAATANIRAIITAENRASGVLRQFGFEAEGIGGKLKQISKTAIFAFGAAASAATAFGLKTAANFETARSALTGLLGSVEEADKTMARIKKEAAATPFELTGLTEGVKQLASVTKTGDEAIDMLLQVGKAVTASGGGQFELDRVVFNLKQIKGIGELSAIDLKELRRAIPIFDKLVEAAGTTVDEIQNAKDPAKALFDVFEKGGKKIKAVDEAFILQAGNFNQLMSNAKDSFAIFLDEFVRSTGIFDASKKAIKAVSDFLSNNRDSLINGFNRLKEIVMDFGRGAMNFFTETWERIGDQVMALGKAVQEHLVPALSDLWHNYIEPLIPVLKETLWGAINIVLEVLTFLAKNIETLGPIMAGFGALLLGSKVLGAINSITIAIAMQGGLMPALTNLAAYIKGGALITPWSLIAAAGVTAAVMIINEWNKARRAIDAAMDSLNSGIKEQGKLLDDAKSKFEKGIINEKTYNRQREIIRKTSEELAEINREAKKSPFDGFFKDIFNFKAGFRTLTGKQQGGVIARGQTAIVGERRPEIFEPREAGRIIPQPRLGGGQTTINLNVNVGMYAGTPMEKRKMAQEMLKAFQDLARQQGTNIAGMI